MALKSYERFKGVTDWRRDAFNDNLQFGITEWIKWSFLNVGGFENVTAAQASGLYGGHPSILRHVNTPNLSNGSVWEGLRSDWVWETGISYSTQPRSCSGVYVNGSFKPTATEVGAYAHYIDFPRGRVVFDTPIDTSSNVRCDYAYRIPTVDFSKKQWMQELLYDSLNVSREDFLAGTGPYTRLAATRRQLPTIGIELSQRSGYQPYQLGGGQFVMQDLLLHILAEDKDTRDKLINILSNQNDKVIVIPDRALMKQHTQFPIDIDLQGRPVNNAMQYPQVIAPTDSGGFAWTRIMLRDVRGDSTQEINHWLYRGVIRLTCEAIFENI